MAEPTEEDQYDRLRPARGLILGLAVGAMLWIAFALLWWAAL